MDRRQMMKMRYHKNFSDIEWEAFEASEARFFDGVLLAAEYLHAELWLMNISLGDMVMKFTKLMASLGIQNPPATDQDSPTPMDGT